MHKRYAVVFTCYSWDKFHTRQLQRIVTNAPGGDVYVVVDETNGVVPGIPWERVIRTGVVDARARDGIGVFMEKGTWKEAEAATFWWNLDYLTWRFFDDHQEYDYCISMDFDACLNLDVDDFVKKVSDRHLDFVGQSHVANMATWFWTPPHLPTYKLDEIHARLLCVTVFSRRAANYLSKRRREMAVAYKAGLLAFWPFCEVFIGTELVRGRFAMADLSEFGSLALYDYRPPKYETGLDQLKAECFVHPVYDADRMLAYLMKGTPRFSDMLRPRSHIRKELGNYPVLIAAKHALRESKRRIIQKFAKGRSDQSDSDQAA